MKSLKYSMDPLQITDKLNEERISFSTNSRIFCYRSLFYKFQRPDICQDIDTDSKRGRAFSPDQHSLINIHIPLKWSRSVFELVLKTSYQDSEDVKDFLVDVDFVFMETLFKNLKMKKYMNAYLFPRFSGVQNLKELKYFTSIREMYIHEVKDPEIFKYLIKLKCLRTFDTCFRSIKFEATNFQNSFLEFFSNKKIDFYLRLECIPKYFELFRQITNNCLSLHIAEPSKCRDQIIDSLEKGSSIFCQINEIDIENYDSFFVSEVFARKINKAEFYNYDICDVIYNGKMSKVKELVIKPRESIKSQISFFQNLIENTKYEKLTLDFSSISFTKRIPDLIQSKIKMKNYDDIIDGKLNLLKTQLKVENPFSLEIWGSSEDMIEISLSLFKTKMIKEFRWLASLNWDRCWEDLIFPYEEFMKHAIDIRNYTLVADKINLFFNLNIGTIAFASQEQVMKGFFNKINADTRFVGDINIHEFQNTFYRVPKLANPREGIKNGNLNIFFTKSISPDFTVLRELLIDRNNIDFQNISYLNSLKVYDIYLRSK